MFEIGTLESKQYPSRAAKPPSGSVLAVLFAGTFGANSSSIGTAEKGVLAHLWYDIRYSVRTLARSPGLAAAAIITVALGVGVNTGIFTVLNGVLFRDLPVPDGRELVAIDQTIASTRDGETSVSRRRFTTIEYRIYRDRTETLSGIIGVSDPTTTTLGGERPRRLRGTIVTCNYFDVLRQPIALGRGLTAQDCEPGAAPVVVLAHGLWTTAFGAEAGILGETVELNRQLFTVVGVAAEDAYSGLGFYETAYFAPISTEPLLLPRESSYGNDRAGWLFLLGRRAATLEQVRAELDVIAAQVDGLEPGRSTTLDVGRATSLGRRGLFRDIAVGVSSVVLTAFGLVLLIACANVANLLLARATARTREIAVRMSLGANRGRVMQQLLVESLLIGVAGGALGSMLALATFPALFAAILPALLPSGVGPVVFDASPDLRVLVFTLAIMLLTSLLFGLAPAIQVSKPDLHTVIKEDTPAAGSRRGARFQGTLVGVQVAVCMVLMIATVLLLRGLNAAQTIDPGFGYDDVAVASLDLLSAGYNDAEAAQFQRRLLDEINSLPGVEAAGYAVLEPLRADSEDAAVRPPSQGAFRVVPVNAVTPKYFDLVDIPIVRGSTFDGADLDDTASQVVVTERTAKNFWPDRDPIGQTLLLAAGSGEALSLTVVGVAADAQVTSVGAIEPYYVYFAAGPPVARLLQLLVESRAGFASTAASIRNAVQALDPGVVIDVTPLEANLAYWRNLSRVATGLSGTLVLLALVLASVGIYGVASYFIGRRTREIGIRMALGAGRSEVVALIVRRTMRPVVVGAVIGVAAAAAVSAALSGVLFGISPYDPVGIAGAAVCVLAVALAAGLVPARRAARTRPMAALHHD